MLEGKSVLVLGAGDLATGVIRRLRLAGALVAATELETPVTVRRRVALSEAVHAGRHTVEGVTGTRSTAESIEEVWKAGEVPVLVDPEATVRRGRSFDVIVDARMAKRNLGTAIDHAPVVIGVGPGFTAGADCHAVVETLQGGGMGRAIFEGAAAADTGEPCALNLPAGCPDPALPPESRVLRAPKTGTLRALRDIGDWVEPGETVAEVDGEPVKVLLKGFLRGLVRDGLAVKEGLKIGEVDLSGKIGRCAKVSEKANAVAGGVLEACCVLLRR